MSANFLPVPLKDIPYVDHPDLKINDHESTEMPFRYVKGEDGLPIMPNVRNRHPEPAVADLHG